MPGRSKQNEEISPNLIDRPTLCSKNLQPGKTNNFRGELPATSLWYPEMYEDNETEELFADDRFNGSGQKRWDSSVQNNLSPQYFSQLPTRPTGAGPPVFNGTENAPPKFLTPPPVFPNPPRAKHLNPQPTDGGLF